MSEVSYTTEIVELPSKGIPYPKDNPLSKGTVEMKYMTAKHEDILTNQSYIKQGVVLDKLFQELIVTDINYDDLLLCDKNAIMIAARIMGYGKEYKTKVTTPSGNEQEVTINLTELKEREVDWDYYTDGENEFSMELPTSKVEIKFRLLTHGIQKKIEAETKAMKKLNKVTPTTTMLKYLITEVNGSREEKDIRKFVDNMLAIDSSSLRAIIKSITPDIDLNVEVLDQESGDMFHTSFTIGLDFFWPDVEV